MWRTLTRILPTILLCTRLINAECPDIVSRSVWRARETVADIRRQKSFGYTPIPFVVIHHTSASRGCATERKCAAAMRTIQNYHKKWKGWPDIGYNFCVGGTGKIYEGRGWDTVGTHAPYYNSRSIGICFIGDFRQKLPSQAMLGAAKSLIECGVDRGTVATDYTLVGHSQVKDTECPGKSLLSEIKTWPHWASIVRNRHFRYRVPSRKSRKRITILAANGPEFEASI